MSRQIAISDLHGCRRTFLALLNQMSLTTADTLFLLGDYVDRGPDSKGVIDAIWELQAGGYAVHCLMGNHEAMLLEDLPREKNYGLPPRGGSKLLRSFGVDRLVDIPPEYFQWVSSLHLYFEIPGYLLVHAGLNFKEPDPLINTHALLWIRDWYPSIRRDWLGDRVIVHGHTPQPAYMTRAQFDHLDALPVLNIDCGCALRQDPYWQLCAVDLTNRRLYFQENVEAD